jgi:hypothetical protein
MAPPSEFDLRAALREGEGDEPDVNDVIYAGRARRAQRRSRILTAAGVIAAAGLVAGVAQLDGGGSGSGGGSDSAAGAQAAASSAPAGGGGAGYGGNLVPATLAPSARKALADVSCPTAAPQYPLAGGGLSSGGGSAELFSRHVTSVVLCAYGPSFDAAGHAPRTPGRLELAGRAASRLANSLEKAPTTAPTASCSGASSQQLAVIPVDAAGNQLPPVTAQVSATACGAMVTNGTAVRYDWQPPPAVAKKLAELTPSEPPDSPVASPVPSGTS